MSIISLDIGLKRIGAALCIHKDIITPLEPILRKNRNQAALAADKILNDWNADVLAVGLPKDESMRERIRHFVSLLKFDKKIVFIDEDFSSYEAKERVKGIAKDRRDGKIDSLSAVIILERYLTQIYV